MRLRWGKWSGFLLLIGLVLMGVGAGIRCGPDFFRWGVPNKEGIHPLEVIGFIMLGVSFLWFAVGKTEKIDPVAEEMAITFQCFAWGCTKTFNVPYPDEKPRSRTQGSCECGAMGGVVMVRRKEDGGLQIQKTNCKVIAPPELVGR